jgi:hypothetical protein
VPLGKRDQDPNKRVAWCAMPGADVSALCVPKGWRFKGSLSEALELIDEEGPEAP